MKFEIHANRYSRIYFRIVSLARSQERIKRIEYESHHIVPRCFGGSHEKDNLVLLTYREHFLCHWLLTKCTSGLGLEKMRFALHAMRMKGRAASWQYEVARRAHRLNLKGKKHFGGQPSEWTEARREAARERGRRPETLKRLAKFRVSKGPKAAAHREALRQSIISLPKIICERCGKLSSPGMHSRWHGANCGTRTHCKYGHTLRKDNPRCNECGRIATARYRQEARNAQRPTLCD